MDDFKKRIKGYRGSGKVCSCCREVDGKKKAARLARARLKQSDQKERLLLRANL